MQIIMHNPNRIFWMENVKKLLRTFILETFPTSKKILITVKHKMLTAFFEW